MAQFKLVSLVQLDTVFRTGTAESTTTTGGRAGSFLFQQNLKNVLRFLFEIYIFFVRLFTFRFFLNCCSFQV